MVQAGDGCSSAVGKWGGEQILTLDNGCFDDNTIAHEFVHAFGFWHEQNRYVKVFVQNFTIRGQSFKSLFLTWPSLVKLRSSTR